MRPAWLIAIFLALVAATGTASAAGDAGSTRPPMPPERPATLAPRVPAAPATAAPQSSPDHTVVATPAKPASSGSTDEPIRTGVVNDGPGTLLELPRASHARMHKCAVAWQKMKETGAAAEKIWFDFALHCLTQ